MRSAAVIGFSDADVYIRPGAPVHGAWGHIAALAPLSSRHIVVRAPRWLSWRFGLDARLDAPQPWLRGFSSELVALVNLAENWDSYGGHPVDPDVARFAYRLIGELLGPAQPLPALIPTSQGGLSLEWHAIDFDVQVNIPPEDDVEVFYRDHGDEWEGDLLDAIPALDRLLATRNPSGL